MRRPCLLLLVAVVAIGMFALPEAPARGAEPALRLVLTQSSPSSRVGTSVRWEARVEIDGAPVSLLAGWEVEFRSDAGWVSGPVPTDVDGTASFTSTGDVAEEETVVAALLTRGCVGVESAPLLHEWWQPTLELDLRVPQIGRANFHHSLRQDPSGVGSPLEVVAKLTAPQELPSDASLQLTEEFYPFYEGGEFERRSSGVGRSEPRIVTKRIPAGSQEVTFTLDPDEHGVALIQVKEISSEAVVPARATASHVWENSVNSFLDIGLETPELDRGVSTTRARATLTSTPHDSTSISPGGQGVLFQFFASDGTIRKLIKTVPTGSDEATAPFPGDLKGVVAVVASLTNSSEDDDPDQALSVESASAVTEFFVPRLTLQPGSQLNARPTGTRMHVAATLARDGQAVEDESIEFALVPHDPNLPEVRRTFRTTSRGHAQLSWTREKEVVDEVTVTEVAPDPRDATMTVSWRDAEPEPLGLDGPPFLVSLSQNEASTPVSEKAELTASVSRLPDEDGGFGRQGALRVEPGFEGVVDVPVVITGDRGFSADVVTQDGGEGKAPYGQQTPGVEHVVAEVRIGGCDDVASDPVRHVWTDEKPKSPDPGEPDSPDPDPVTPIPPDPIPPVPDNPPVVDPPETPTTPVIEPPVTPPPPPPPPPVTSGSVGSTTTAVHPGGPLGVSGTGCSPHEEVTVRLGGVVVGTTTADADGNFTLTTVVPDMALGRYYLSSSCGATSTEPVDVTRTEAMSGQVGALATAAGGVLAFFVLVGAGLLRRLSG